MHRAGGSNEWRIKQHVPSESSAVAEWAPVWGAVEESPQYKCGMLRSYLHKWKIEEAEPIEDSAFPPERLRGGRYTNAHQKIKTFLQQIRASRGYDVDVYPPDFVRSPFCPMRIDALLEYELTRQLMEEQVNCVIAHINALAEMHGERYGFQQYKKVVEARSHRTTLFTFTVKELARNPNVVKTVQAMVYTKAYNPRKYEVKEWRFKPEEEEDTT